MTGKIKTTVGLKVRPLIKTDLRATNAGEFCANMGCEDGVAAAQKGFQLGVLEKIVVYGINQNGHAVDHAVFGVSAAGDGNDVISIADDDTISMIERTDRGAAIGVSQQYARFRARGLYPSASFFYRPDIARDPAARARYNAELGLVEREPIQVAPGFVIDTVRLTPGRDNGQYFEFGRGRKR